MRERVFALGCAGVIRPVHDACAWIGREQCLYCNVVIVLEEARADDVRRRLGAIGGKPSGERALAAARAETRFCFRIRPREIARRT